MWTEKCKNMDGKMKKIVVVFLLLITFNLMPGAQKPVKMPIKIRKISDRVMVLSIGFLQTIALSSEKGLVVIDTNRGPSCGKEIRQCIVEEFGRKDFIYVINTHYHYDHSGGNSAFADIKTIAHERCIEGFRKNEDKDFSANEKRYKQIADSFKKKLKGLDPKSTEARDIPGTIQYLLSTAKDFKKGFIVTPLDIIFNERLTLNLGDITAQLSYLGNIHSNTDIIIYVPEEKLLMMGDAFSSRRIPNLGENLDLEVSLLITNMNAVLKLYPKVNQLISGHTGDDMTIEEWKDRRDYIVLLKDKIAAAQKTGLTLRQVQEMYSLNKIFPKFMKIKHEWGGKNIHKKNIETMWKILSARNR